MVGALPELAMTRNEAVARTYDATMIEMSSLPRWMRLISSDGELVKIECVSQLLLPMVICELIERRLLALRFEYPSDAADL